MLKLRIYALCFKVARFLLWRERPSWRTHRQPVWDNLLSLGNSIKGGASVNPGDTTGSSNSVIKSNEGKGDLYEKNDDIA